MYHPIRDYGIIGNLRSAVLISKDGSIDWAPAPFMDSPSIFASILDEHKGGSWQIMPKDSYTSSQTYLGNTNILVTRFVTDTGIFEVTDFIPIESERSFVPAEKNTTFKIHRRVACIKGSGDLVSLFCPKFDYGRGETELSEITDGIRVQNGTRRGVLVSRVVSEIKRDHAIAEFNLKAGETTFFVFRYNTGTAIFRADDKGHHERELVRTKNYWEDWVSRGRIACVEKSETWYPLVRRSLLLLKILFFEPVGTVAAAPTTSLPESIGGIRNWDYRFTWLRDSSFIFQVFFLAGYRKEAEDYLSWLVGECYTAENPAEMQIMYGLRGETKLTEEFLPHLSGYRGSQPVRIGNGAYDQRQWDIYGSIMQVAWQLHSLRQDELLDEKLQHVLCAIAHHVVKIWREPDEGLWEVRGGKQHFVYSKVMCWTALDRAVKLAEINKLENCEEEVDTWARERDAIRAEVFTRGWSEKKQSFVQSFGSECLDAAILLMPATGFIDGDDSRMLSTISRIQEELSVGDNLLLRYKAEDGLPGQEGAFLLASFWLVDALVLAKKDKEARTLFESLVKKTNHVGLFSEEMDPKTEEFLGNFPQAYTHIGLINSAFLLSKSTSVSEEGDIVLKGGE
jgi:GH15 family glucan-1,4-alpha-glucosidase